MKKLLCFVLAITFVLSFTAFASDDFKCTDSSILNGSNTVFIDEKEVVLTFSELVASDLSNISDTPITKNGDTLVKVTDYTAALDEFDATKVIIKFAELEYGATYVIDYSGYKNSEGNLPVNEPATLTFTVETAPEVEISDPVIISGFETGVITNPGYFTTNKLQGVELSVNNKAAGNKKITVIFAVYDANGIIKKIVTSTKEVEAGKIDSIGTGTLIPADANLVKVFVWDDMTNKCPYIGSFSYSFPS